MDLKSDEYFQFFSESIKERENSIILNQFEPKNSKIFKYEYFNESKNKQFDQRSSKKNVN